MKNLIITLLLAMPMLAEAQLKYDEKGPDFHKPTLERAAKDYDPLNTETFSIWADNHTIAEPENTDREELYRYAMWCTKEATYVMTMYLTNWPLHYFHGCSNSYIEDCDTGVKYMLKSASHPLDETYWMRTLAQEWVCTLDVFPPLPPTCKYVTFGGGEYTDDLKPGWSHTKNPEHVEVSRLQANQPLFKYQKAVVVY